MIGTGGTGSSFGGLVKYLTGSAGQEEEEQDEDWLGAVRTQNTFEIAARPMAVAEEMEDAAAMSERAEKPVYHLTISWPIEDQTTTQERMEVMEEVLEDIGLGDRQALIVEHLGSREEGRTDLPHVHAMVNRVQHDYRREDYGTAWDTSGDWSKIEHSLRRIEKDRGWRVVPGKMSTNHDTPKEEIGNALTSGQMQYFVRTGELPLVEKVRIEVGEDFKTARSWDELDAAVRDEGWKIERKRSGGVVRHRETGEAVKLSSVGYSLGKLEDRFDETYGEYLERRKGDVRDQRKRGQSSGGEQEPERERHSGRKPEKSARASHRENGNRKAEGRGSEGVEEGAERSAQRDGSAQKRDRAGQRGGPRDQRGSGGPNQRHPDDRSDDRGGADGGEVGADREGGGHGRRIELSPDDSGADDGGGDRSLEQLADGADSLDRRSTDRYRHRQRVKALEQREKAREEAREWLRAEFDGSLLSEGEGEDRQLSELSKRELQALKEDLEGRLEDLQSLKAEIGDEETQKRQLLTSEGLETRKRLQKVNTEDFERWSSIVTWRSVRSALREVQQSRQGKTFHDDEMQELEDLDKAQRQYQTLSEAEQEDFRERLDSDLEQLLDEAIDPGRKSYEEVLIQEGEDTEAPLGKSHGSTEVDQRREGKQEKRDEKDQSGKDQNEKDKDTGPDRSKRRGRRGRGGRGR